MTLSGENIVYVSEFVDLVGRKLKCSALLKMVAKL